MSITWTYPLYVIPHGMGYASIVEPRPGESLPGESLPGEPPADRPRQAGQPQAGAGTADNQPPLLLVVHTDCEAAQEFMDQFGIQGSPRELANAREFSWLLRNLRHPTTRVAFDPRPRETDVNARWTVTVRRLLDEFLKIDYSPWNYPVFAILQDDGFASIQGQPADEPLTAVGIFTRMEKAEAYLREAEETGSLHELPDMDSVRDFLEELSDQVTAVALDPSVADGRRTAKHCFKLRTLLDKYLVFDT